MVLLILPFVLLQKSDAQWDAASKLTAQAGEQSRIAQSRTTEAVKFTQTAEEARRAAEQTHKKEDVIEVCSYSVSSLVITLDSFSCFH
jgi:hypothetical protein